MFSPRYSPVLLAAGRWITIANKAIIALLIFLMVVEVLAIVVLRYVFHSPPFGGEELARYMMFYLVLLGSAISIRTDEHPRLTLVYDALPKSVRLVWGWVLDLLIAIVLIVLFWQGWLLVQDEGITMTPALRVSYFWVYLAFPIGAALMMIQLVLRRLFPTAKD